MYAFLFFLCLSLFLGSIAFRYVVPEITAILCALFAGLMLVSADDWNIHYWTHDLKTGDVLLFPYASREKLASLQVSGSKEEDSLTYSGTWTVADVHGGQCSGNEVIGQTIDVVYSPENPGSLYVIGRATRPDYRYLLEKRTPGCVTDYLVSRRGMAGVKVASKHYGAVLAEKSVLPLEAVILERNSVRPLR